MGVCVCVVFVCVCVRVVSLNVLWLEYFGCLCVVCMWSLHISVCVLINSKRIHPVGSEENEFWNVRKTCLGHVTSSANGQLYTIKRNNDFLMRLLKRGVGDVPVSNPHIIIPSIKCFAFKNEICSFTTTIYSFLSKVSRYQ